MTIHNLRTCYQTRPLALEEATPLFSWELCSEVPLTEQTAYQVVVKNGQTTVWDSGRVDSDETLNIAYAGSAIAPHTVYSWQVTVWDNHGNAVTDESFWRSGYMGTPWLAPFICAEDEVTLNVAPRLRRIFTLKEQPAAAYATVYSPCWFHLQVNGATPDDRQLTPAAAPNEEQIYEVYDLTGCLQAGENVIGLWLGDGYDQGFTKWGWRYTGPKRATMELRVTYADGSEQLISTDGDWKASKNSAVVFNSIYHGETFDFRLAEAWDTAGYDASDWSSAVVLGAPEKPFFSRYIPPVRVTRYDEPVNWWRTADGKLILDYGQNRGGWVRMRLSGKAGDEVSLHFSEEINRETRELDPFTNRTAKATDTVIFSGKGVDEFEPRFTYHGFRYVEVTGWEGPVLPGYFTACTLHCDMPQTGDFTCDDPSINQLFNNILWGVRGNAVSYPTDCPMRDERTPCQHDVVVYFDLASHFYDAGMYFRRFAHYTLLPKGNAGWEGAQVTIAWFLYNWFGDRSYLEECYDTLRTYVHNCEADYPELCGSGFGDWCAPKENADGGYLCAFSYVAPTCTALMYYQTDLFGKIAKALGHDEELAWVEARKKTIAESYHKNFYNAEKGWYDEGEQTAGVLPLYFGMVPDELHAQIVKSILDGLVRKDGHVDTGIYGTKYLPLVMAKEGHLDTVLDAFFQPTYPSYGYTFSKGATTIWEQWWERGGMTSHNHGMFGGGGTFIYESLAGFASSENAGKTMMIKPVLSNRVHQLDCTAGTPRGQYRVAYTREKGTFSMTVTVPVGCTAYVTLPDGSDHVCSHGEHQLFCAD